MRICPTCGDQVATALHRCPQCTAPLPEPGPGDLPPEYRPAAGYPAEPEYCAEPGYHEEPEYPPPPEPGRYPPGRPRPGPYQPGPYQPGPYQQAHDQADRYLPAPYQPGPCEPERNDLARTHLASTEPDPYGQVLYEDDLVRADLFGDRFAGRGWETGDFPAPPAPDTEPDAQRENTAARLLYSPPGRSPRAASRGAVSRRTQIASALAVVALLTGGVIAWTASGGHQGAAPGAHLAGGQTASRQASPAPRGRATPSPSVPPPRGAATVVTMAPGVSQVPDAAMVDGFLVSYFTAINAHDYQQYTRLLIPARRAQLAPAVFTRGYGTTTDTGANIVGVSATGDSVAATVTFTSQQTATPGAGVTGCTYWDITLYLRKQGATLLMGNPPAGYHAYHRSCP